MSESKWEDQKRDGVIGSRYNRGLLSNQGSYYRTTARPRKKTKRPLRWNSVGRWNRRGRW